jgi:hypothetical protein
MQVSRDGGDQPRWRRHGKELFCLSLDGKLMTVNVTEGPTFKAEVPRSLFQALVVRGRRESFLGVLCRSGRQTLSYQHGENAIRTPHGCAELDGGLQEEMNLAAVRSIAATTSLPPYQKIHSVAVNWRAVW